MSAASFDVATRVKATPSSLDSPLEGNGFELPVPRQIVSSFNALSEIGPIRGCRVGIVNLTGCGQGDAHREAACANNYAAVITLLISAQTRNVCVLEALCSAAVT